MCAKLDILDRIAGQADIDVVNDFAMPVSAEALKSVTGLTNMDWREMDRVSQGMIDGCANYTGDPTVEGSIAMSAPPQLIATLQSAWCRRIVMISVPIVDPA